MEKMRNAISVMLSEPFVLATGLAALVHSTWTLAMMFSGDIPNLQTHTLDAIYTIAPAFLLAFSIDVGQIMTSNDIRKGMRNAGKIATFAVLALATYYLQWMYMIAHVPALALGAGVRPEWRMLVETVRDASIWVIPALLPIATTLYTMSNAAHDVRTAQPAKRSADKVRKVKARRKERAAQAQPAMVGATRNAPSGAPGNPATDELADAVVENADETFTGMCPNCDYRTDAKPTERAAKNALAAHKRACKGRSAEADAVLVASNGHSNGAH